MLTNRVKFIQYKGTEVLLVDASNATEEEAINMIPDADEIIKKNINRAPFLFLGDYTKVRFNLGLIEKFKASLNSHQKQIKKYAAIGVPATAKVFANIITQNLPYELEFFDTREEGLGWLVKEKN